MIKKAIGYISGGLPVFPLSPGTKIPMQGTRGFYDATTDDTQVNAWWTQTPNANIGIPTGKETFTVVDFDKKHGGLDTFEAWCQDHPELAKQPRVKTPGGLHVYFKYNAELGMTVELAPGVDVRNDGGYVVAAGSVTPQGAYQVEHKARLAELPDWLLQVQRDRKAEKQRATSVASGDTTLQDQVYEGGRNAYLTKIAGALRRQGVEPHSLLDALEVINVGQCNPPLDTAELGKVANSVARYEPEPDELSPATIVPVKSYVESMLTYLNDKERVKGDSTGIAGLDKLLGGGFRSGEVTAIHAEAKIGKNALIHKIIHYDMINSQPVGYASRELSPDTEVLPNLLSIELQRNVLTSDPTPKEFSKAADKWPLYFAYGYGYFPIEDLTTWVKECKSKYGVTHYWMDHLHYMLEEPEDHKAASKLAKQIKTLAKRLDVHIGLIIQPNKLYDGQSVGLATLKGGSAIGQAIDNLITIERQEQDDTVSKVTLAVARSRLARKGSINLRYDRDTMDYIEVEFQPDRQQTTSQIDGIDDLALE